MCRGRASYNTALLRHAGELFRAEGAEFAIYGEWSEVPIYNEELDGRLNDRNLEDQVREVVRNLIVEVESNTASRLTP
jgi:NAD(P)H-dependent FMN reductase